MSRCWMSDPQLNTVLSHMSALYNVINHISVVAILVSISLPPIYYLLCLSQEKERIWSLDGVVSTLTTLMTGWSRNSGSIPSKCKRFSFSFSGNHPSIEWLWGSPALGVKQLERKANNSPLSFCEIKRNLFYILISVCLHVLLIGRFTSIITFCECFLSLHAWYIPTFRVPLIYN
jgi:hypothetical protein